jgi:hypothetical protein
MTKRQRIRSPIKNFFRVWILLSIIYLGTRIGATYFIAGYVGWDTELWTHVLVVPLFQALLITPLLMKAPGSLQVAAKPRRRGDS